MELKNQKRLILTEIFVHKLPVIFSNLLAAFLHLLLLTVHIHLTVLSIHLSQLSSHPNILSDVFDQSFHISVLFRNRTFDLSCLSCHMWIVYTRIELKSLLTHRLRNVLPVVTWIVRTPCEPTTPEHSGTEVMSSWFHTIQYNFANRKIILILSDMYSYHSFKECLIK